MSGKKILLAVLFAAGALALCRADDAAIRKLLVDVEMTAAPDVEYRAHNAFSPKKPSTSKWMMLKIEYTPDQHNTFVPAYRKRRGGPGVFFPGWIDNVKLDAKVLFDVGVTYNKKPVYGLFTGETVFWSIKRDGGKHLALMFVPARLLDRYCVPGTPGGRGVNKNIFKVMVEMSAGGKVLAKAFSNIAGKSDAERSRNFNRLVQEVPAGLNLAGTILPRSRSPWALLAPDNYDLEKDEKQSGAGVAQE